MGKDLVPFQPETFAVLQMEHSDLVETITENIGTDSINEWDLDRVKVPSGGGTTWTIPSLEGEDESKEIEGIIVHWANRRAYWEKSFEETGGDTPPECSSLDAVVGIGEPGGMCADCVFAQFGSGKDGIGQACKQTRQLFVLPTNSIIPLVLTLPPGSLANAKRYFLRLVSAGMKASNVVTKFALEKDKSTKGIIFSRVTLTAGPRLDPDSAAAIASYAEMMKPMFERVAREEQAAEEVQD